MRSLLDTIHSPWSGEISLVVLLIEFLVLYQFSMCVSARRTYAYPNTVVIKVITESESLRFRCNTEIIASVPSIF